ncbi:hypothetical protein AMELA_G00215000, partial [Ameiurus melas]
SIQIWKVVERKILDKDYREGCACLSSGGVPDYVCVCMSEMGCVCLRGGVYCIFQDGGVEGGCHQGAGFTSTTSGLNLPQKRCVSFFYSLLFPSTLLSFSLSLSLSLSFSVCPPCHLVFTTSSLDKEKLRSVHPLHS